MAEIALVNLLLLLGAALLLAGILSSLLALRLGAPLLLVFLVIGMLAGEDGPLGITFSDYRATYLVGTLSLSLILFDGGMRTRFSTFRLALAPAVLLATFGVAVTAAVTGLAAWWWLGLPLLGALLVGSVLGSTDAAAVMLLLRAGGVQVDQRVGALLEVESGLNDPMAVMLTLLLVGLLAAGAAEPTVGGVALFLLRQGVIGAAAGLAGGGLAVLALARLQLTEGLRPALAVAFGLTIAALAAVLDGSGLLAAYVAGLVVGNRRPPGIAAVLDFSEAVTWIAQIGMFLLIGLLVTPTRLLADLQPGLVVFAVLTFLARPVAVVLCLMPFRFTWREHVFAAWVGLRGSVAVLLAAIPALAGLAQGERYFNLVFIAVLASLLLQGWTLRRLAHALGLLLPARPAPSRAVLDLPGARDAEIMAFPIVAASPALSHPLPDWVRPVLLLSGGHLQPAPAELRLKPGETLYVLAPPGRESEVDRFFAPEAEDEAPGLGSFSVDGAALVAELAAAYGLAAPPVPANETVAGLFAAEYGGMVGLGDRVRLAGLSLVAEDVQDGQVTRAALDLDPTPERRDAARLLLRRLRVMLRRLRRPLSSRRKVSARARESADSPRGS
jgi:cell volume regulation protein A